MADRYDTSDNLEGQFQPGMPLLDFTYLTEHEAEYISAIHQGHAGNYDPMKRVFSEVLQASMREE